MLNQKLGTFKRAAALEKLSTIVRMTELPWEKGRPVTKSKAMYDQGPLEMGSGWRRPTGGWFEALLCT